jgi:hypothetical protein
MDEISRERVNGNVDNEIELGMKIPMIKPRILQVSQKQKEYGINVCGNNKVPLWEYTGIITDIQIRFLPERSLVNVWSFPEP